MKKVSRYLQLEQLLIYVRSSFWFVPTLMILGAIGLATGMVAIDERFGDFLREWQPGLFDPRAEGARAMLSAIAGSMATVAGVVFSITIVALALASSQYTSRVLRNFMRDRATQTVLGVFVGVYIYCLLVLRTVSGGEESYVPGIAVLVAVGLAIVAIGFFIFFIHHIASSIQVSEIAVAITRETLASIDRLFPAEIGNGTEQPPADVPSDCNWHPVPSTAMGYIQSVDPQSMLDFARERQTILRMESGVGDFVATGHPIVSLNLEQPPGEETIAEINKIFAVSSYRTIDQDAAFGIRQLVDIALMALSPGVNDPTTAVTCIEHLSVLLSRCGGRCIAPPYRYEEQALRVIARGPTFENLVALSFQQILESAESNTEVLLRMVIAVNQVAYDIENRDRLRVLATWADRIEAVAKRSVKSDYALQQIADCLDAARATLAK